MSDNPFKLSAPRDGCSGSCPCPCHNHDPQDEWAKAQAYEKIVLMNSKELNGITNLVYETNFRCRQCDFNGSLDNDERAAMEMCHSHAIETLHEIEISTVKVVKANL
jgi:hypothetical protein